MRTKTTLLCAAVLAAGVASSMAQNSNVYSLNIVGYANVPVGNEYNLLSNPFDTTPNDSATNVFPNPNTVQQGNYPGPWDHSSIETWTGLGFTVAVFDSETSDASQFSPPQAFTGFLNAQSTATVPAPNLGSGLGYYLYNQANGLGVRSTNVTFVGTVRTGTNSINYAVSPRVYFVGSPLPLAGGVSSVLGLSNPNTVQNGNYSGPLDHSTIQIPNISASGAVLGYTVAVFDSETSDASQFTPPQTFTGFLNPQSTATVPEPTVAIGLGFAFLSQANGVGSTSFTWTQILNP